MTLLRSIALATLLVTLLSSPLAASADDQRTLGMVVTYPEHGDYESALQLAIDAGATRVPLTFFWSALEPQEGIYDDRVLAIAALYFPAMGIAVDLAITPISGSRLVLPNDLAGRALDDPEVVVRYQELLEHVLNVFADVDIGVLLLGVDADSYLGDDPDAWASYTSLVTQSADFVHSQRPDVEIGVQSSTYSRIEHPELWAGLDALCDFIATSYYPLDDLTVRDPSVVSDDFDALTALYPGRVIRITEAGYPSSRINGSSAELQAQFIHELFAAWDLHADQILSITLATEHEYDPLTVEAFQRFSGERRPAYSTFIGSIGLRQWNDDGRAKPAWLALLEETGARGWRP